MLQAISSHHDTHHEHAMRSSAAAVAASRFDGKIHLLLAASGSVATIKIPNIIRALAKHPNLAIRVVLTESAARFLAGQTAEQPTVSSIAHLPNVQGVHTDRDEWEPAWRRGQPILHIELRKWADLLVVAPLSANTLAKVVNGLSDDLLSSVIRAWDTTGWVDGPVPDVAESEDASGNSNGNGVVPGRPKRKILAAPAMNTAMWRHPVTGRQLKVLEAEWGGEDGWFEVLRPVEKTLACGDVGDGAMKNWEEIVGIVEDRLGLGPPTFEDP